MGLVFSVAWSSGVQLMDFFLSGISVVLFDSVVSDVIIHVSRF